MNSADPVGANGGPEHDPVGASGGLEHEVVIVGGGPVGIGLALELGLRGVRCAVVERHEQPQPIPKGQNLTQRTMEHFRSWGVEEAVRSARVMPAGAPTSGVTAYGSLLSDYSYPWWRRADLRRYYYTGNERLPQYCTEQVLRAAAMASPSVDCLIGWTASSVIDHGSSVAVEIAGGGRDTRRTLRAQYAVGCDGSRSTVREQAGIELRLTDHDRSMVLLVFRSAELHRLLTERHPDASFFNVLHPSLDGYWQFLGRVDAEGQWFFHAPVTGARPGMPDQAACRRLVGAAVGADVDIVFDYIGEWDLRFATARRYRSGRVFVAGDAAHSHPPYGGYGINTGFEDARNLGWKMAAALQGWAGEGLLDSYDPERRSVFESTSADFIEAFIERDRRFVRAFDPEVDLDAFEEAWSARQVRDDGVATFEPHYEGSPVVFGPPGGVSSARGSHSGAARPGHHLPPCPLSAPAAAAAGEAGPEVADVSDLLGRGFTLVALDAPPAVVEDFRSAAARGGVPLTVVADSFDGDRRQYGCRLALVRPDHYVAWAGREAPEDPAAVLARATGH